LSPASRSPKLERRLADEQVVGREVDGAVEVGERHELGGELVEAGEEELGHLHELGVLEHGLGTQLHDLGQDRRDARGAARCGVMTDRGKKQTKLLT
jgi:hypothetical protein